MYHKMFEYFIENDLISHNQSDFKPGDSFITRGVFLDISKALDKGWHEGLLFKLKENGKSCKLLNTVKDFLYQRKQRVILNG